MDRDVGRGPIKNAPELERSTWLVVEAVLPGGEVVRLEADPEEFLECLDRECLSDLYETYVKPLTGSEAVAAEWLVVKGSKIVKYSLEEGVAYVVVRRVDRDLASVISELGGLRGRSVLRRELS
ncbi:MAG: hypothetical protein DRO39_08040 [Thermoprotei archaeon]|nr:MAG: hypothetical protein DRO39_08040 [Thermoprotei archaeon]